MVVQGTSFGVSFNITQPSQWFHGLLVTLVVGFIKNLFPLFTTDQQILFITRQIPPLLSSLVSSIFTTLPPSILISNFSTTLWHTTLGLFMSPPTVTLRFANNQSVY